MKSLKNFKLWATVAIISLLTGFFLIWKPYQKDLNLLTIAAGDPNGQYYKKAQEISQLLESEFKFKVEVLITSGSSDNLSLVSRGQADVGFFQSGADHKIDSNSQNVLSIADVFPEGLFPIVQKGLNLSSIIELEDKRVACGPLGSGTNKVVKDLYRASKIKINNTNCQAFDFERSKWGLEKGELDAAFFVMSPEAPLIKALLQNPKLSILPMDEWLPAYRSHLTYLSELFIPKGWYSIKDPLSPERHLNILSTDAEVIYSKKIDLWHLECLLRAIKSIKWEKGYPNVESLEFPLDSLTKEVMVSGFKWYHDRRIPFVLRQNLRLVLLVSVLVPTIFVLLKILPGLLRLPALPIMVMRTMSLNRFYEKIAKDLSQGEILLLADELHAEMARVNRIWAPLPGMNSAKREWLGDLTNLAAHLKLLLEYRQQPKFSDEG